MTKAAFNYVAEYAGKPYSRSSNRVYEYAVGVTTPSGPGILCWCGRHDLACKQLDRAQSKPAYFSNVQIVRAKAS